MKRTIEITASFSGKIPMRRNKNIMGNKNPNWKGGKKYSYGYIMIYKPDHPKQIKNYVYEHRLVMETHIGRILKDDECIHHINEKQDDNRIENLVLTNKSEHMRKFHAGMSAETRFKKGVKFLPFSEERRKRMSESAKRRWQKARELCNVK